MCLTILILLYLTSTALSAATLTGRTVRVTDGDTVVILSEARGIINQWLDEYNTVRPHVSLQGRTPKQFKRQWLQNNEDQTPTTLTA